MWRFQVPGQKALMVLAALASAAILAFALFYAERSKAGGEAPNSDAPGILSPRPKVTVDWSRLRCAPEAKETADKPKHDLTLLYKYKKNTSMTVELTKKEYEEMKKQQEAKKPPDE